MLNLLVKIQARCMSGGGGASRSHGKRPSAKIKILASMGENIYRTTKVFRFVDRNGLGPKPKWQGFLGRNAAQHAVWREWWKSPQSERWRNLHKTKPAVAEGSSSEPKSS